MAVSEKIGVFSSVEELLDAGFSWANIAPRVEPSSVLMCDPTYFEIKDTKNPFMAGNLNATDPKKANRQWHQLKRVFEELGHPVRLISAQKSLEDMVFTANQTLPGRDAQNNLYAVLSEMVHPSRRNEVPFFEEWFSSNGYKILRLCGETENAPRFEGQGDAIWHPRRQLLWGGYGFRTEKAAYGHLLTLIDAPIIALQLVNDKFYHLDTAFCVLDENTVMIYPGAFDETGLRLIGHVFDRVIEVSEEDAGNFACNALALGEHVILQTGSRETCRKLAECGFKPVQVETSEFMKSGGSVFCLKMMVY